MIKITPEGEFGPKTKPLAYTKQKSLLSYIVLPITRWLRAIHAEKYINAKGSLLDIGVVMDILSIGQSVQFGTVLTSG